MFMFKIFVVYLWPQIIIIEHENFQAFNFRGLAHPQKYFNSKQYSNYGIIG